jgi:endonuclease III
MPRESKLAKYQRALAILKALHELYPNATTELDHANPFELLISTILSAQATDVSVNAAAPALYKKYPDAFALAKATPEEVIPYIKTIGLYRNKAKNIIAAAQQLVERFNGEVPDDFEAVTSLPGVGRKTANVVLSNAFGRPAIAVDTHVGRLARRLALSKHDNPDKVETDLQKVFPVEEWIFAHHALILHGRRVCQARKPLCEACALSALCPSSTV